MHCLLHLAHHDEVVVRSVLPLWTEFRIWIYWIYWNNGRIYQMFHHHSLSYSVTQLLS